MDIPGWANAGSRRIGDEDAGGASADEDEIVENGRKPRGTVENRQLIDGANRQFQPAAETGKFYFAAASERKSVWSFVRQLRGPHLSTCA